jgi:hypothetical protein
MSIAPHAGIIDFGTFTPPTGGMDGVQGEVPAPLSSEVGYVLSTNGWIAAGGGGGSGTVTSVSVTSANGFAGTVANATTTPAITLSTSVTGIVKGNGTALSAASAGTDYVAPGPYTTSGLTMATARVLGRTTASTGAAEEITIGSGLSLAGGSLSNSAPDQTVVLTQGGTTTITGTYPSFTISSADQFVGTVTSVGGTGTVNGITLTGTVSSTGNLTLGGTLSGVSLTTQVSGTLPVANGGTGVTTSTGTGSTVLSTAPALSGATLNDGYTEEVFAVTDGGTVNLDPNNGSIQTWTLGASRTPGQANWAAGQSITLMVDDGAAYTITWSTLAVVWETNAGSAPTLATSGFTTIVLWKVGTTIYGARVGDA